MLPLGSQWAARGQPGGSQVAAKTQTDGSRLATYLAREVVRLIIGVDLGYGWTKGVSETGTFLEPSVVGPAEQTLEGLGPVEGTRLWDDEGEFFIGSLALRHCHFPWHNLSDDKPSDPSTMRLLKAAIAGVLSQPVGRVRVDVLVSGLPVNLWSSQRAALEQRLNMQNMPIRAQLGRARVEAMVTVHAARVLAQPYGSLLDYVLDDAGQLVRTDVVRGRVLVIDIGFHTVDLLACDGLEPIGRLSLSTNFGLAAAYAAVGKRLNKPVWEVDHLVVTGRMSGLNEAYRHLAGNISRTIEGLNERFDFCLVTGGGGVALYPFLQVSGRKDLISRAQMANVQGYLKAGERIRRQALAG